MVGILVRSESQLATNDGKDVGGDERVEVQSTFDRGHHVVAKELLDRPDQLSRGWILMQAHPADTPKRSRNNMTMSYSCS
jgi:hypothetical protein